jgi:methylenetetrahydrofolate dehydrogenase (NADP+)/methenyltetrahydrofolate cyclohydrolase
MGEREMLIYGKEIRAMMQEKIKQKLTSKKVKLVVLQFGEEAASLSYIKGISRFAAEVGAGFELLQFADTITETEALEVINKLNQDDTVQGIMIQTPLPKHFNKETIINSMDPHKDVEGITSFNLGQLLLREGNVKPCTPKAVISMLKGHGISLKGKKVTVVGASAVVGLPLAIMLLAEKATVTVCNSSTVDLAKETRNAEIIVAAVGRINLITPEMVSEGAIVIDVGTNFDENGKMRGDVDPEVQSKAVMLSAVPGGVGLITVAELFDNLANL